jgi:hypothetical protein
MALRWKDVPDAERFRHDRDVKSMSVIDTGLQRMAIEKIDPNHVFKKWNSTVNRDDFMESEPSDPSAKTENCRLLWGNYLRRNWS